MPAANTVIGQVCDVFIAGEVAFTGMVVGNNKLVEKSFSRAADLAEARDGNNAVFSVARSNRTSNFTIGIIFFNSATATLAAARTIGDALPELLLVAVITGTGKAIENGSYHVMGASLVETGDGKPAMMKLELKSFVENALASGAGLIGSLGAPVTLTLAGS